MKRRAFIKGVSAIPASIPLATMTTVSTSTGWVASLGYRPLILINKSIVLRKTLDLSYRHGSIIKNCVIRAGKAMLKAREVG